MKKKIHIKFCGMTQQRDIQKAIGLEADYIGMVFYRQSPRYVSNAKAKEICSNVDFKKTCKAGVFVNSTIKEILHTVAVVGLDVIQLHGDDNIDTIKEIQKHTPAIIWKTVRINKKKSIEIIRQSNMDFFLIDTFSHKSYGGTGRRLDIDLVKESCSIQNQDPRKKIIVAGGLNHSNVETILAFHPWGIDINSGVEDRPGIKNHSLMNDLVKTVNNYFF